MVKLFSRQPAYKIICYSLFFVVLVVALHTNATRNGATDEIPTDGIVITDIDGHQVMFNPNHSWEVNQNHKNTSVQTHSSHESSSTTYQCLTQDDQEVNTKRSNNSTAYISKTAIKNATNAKNKNTLNPNTSDLDKQSFNKNADTKTKDTFEHDFNSDNDNGDRVTEPSNRKHDNNFNKYSNVSENNSHDSSITVVDNNILPQADDNYDSSDGKNYNNNDANQVVIDNDNDDSTENDSDSASDSSSDHNYAQFRAKSETTDNNQLNFEPNTGNGDNSMAVEQDTDSNGTNIDENVDSFARFLEQEQQLSDELNRQQNNDHSSTIDPCDSGVVCSAPVDVSTNPQHSSNSTNQDQQSPSLSNNNDVASPACLICSAVLVEHYLLIDPRFALAFLYQQCQHTTEIVENDSNSDSTNDRNVNDVPIIVSQDLNVTVEADEQHSSDDSMTVSKQDLQLLSLIMWLLDSHSNEYAKHVSNVAAYTEIAPKSDQIEKEPPQAIMTQKQAEEQAEIAQLEEAKIAAQLETTQAVEQEKQAQQAAAAAASRAVIPDNPTNQTNEENTDDLLRQIPCHSNEYLQLIHLFDIALHSSKSVSQHTNATTQTSMMDIINDTTSETLVSMTEIKEIDEEIVIQEVIAIAASIEGMAQNQHDIQEIEISNQNLMNDNNTEVQMAFIPDGEVPQLTTNSDDISNTNVVNDTVPTQNSGLQNQQQQQTPNYDQQEESLIINTIMVLEHIILVSERCQQCYQEKLGQLAIRHWLN